MDLIIKPTELCNFKCTFCSSTQLTDEKKNWLKHDQIFRFLERFPETKTIIVNGGDPLMMEPDYYWKIINWLDEKEYTTSLALTTNLWPFYKKMKELDIPLFVHTGFNWVAPGLSSNCHPMLLEEVCLDFPELPIVAFHMGYPYCTEMNLLAAKHENLYASSSLLPRFGLGYTKKAQEMLGEFLAIAGPDKLTWGVDWSGSLAGHKKAVEYLETIQISEELQRDYHYPPITDETRRKWAGLNMAKLLKIDVPPSS